MRMYKQLDLSFIIPAYNEEEAIPKLLNSIIQYTPAVLTHEIFIADNGSTDTTVEIAHKHNANVIIDKTARVGALRNKAARSAKGHVLVFLDADILLTKAWGDNIHDVFNSLLDDPWQVTGSKCGVSTNPGWIEKFWFKPMLNKEVKYINSAHLITSRKLFNDIGGFDDSLESGEDYAFSQAAMSVNAKVINNNALAVIHEGYPKTLIQFMRREIWHGRGDCASIRRIKESKVAILSILFFILNIFSFSSFIFYSNVIAGLIGLLLIASICIGLALYKHGYNSMLNLVIASMLYYFYMISRFLSCVPPAKYGTDRRHHRLIGD